jgi:hypothetical protein
MHQEKGTDALRHAHMVGIVLLRWHEAFTFLSPAFPFTGTHGVPVYGGEHFPGVPYCEPGKVQHLTPASALCDNANTGRHLGDRCLGQTCTRMVAHAVRIAGETGCMHLPMRTHTRAHAVLPCSAHTRTHIQAGTHARTHASLCSYHAWTRTQTQAGTRPHTPTPTSHARAHAHAHTPAHANTRLHTLRTHRPKHTQTHAPHARTTGETGPHHFRSETFSHSTP